MRCLYCDEDYYINSSFIHYLFTSDPLCSKCRKALDYKPKSFVIGGKKGRAFYVYDEAFSSMIIAFKEANDEALKDIFLYPFIDYLNIKYRNYTLIYAPSSKTKKKERGFNHLELICQNLKLKKVDILYKTKDISQTLKNQQERKEIKEYIALKEIKKFDRVLLIDDVLTSGNTMLKCVELLKPLCNEISFISLSYSKQWND